MSQSPVIQLLHRADALVPQFNSAHGKASQLAHAVYASECVLLYLMAERLMERTGQQTPASGSVRERTLAKLQNTIEEALAGIRGELANMENVVEQLKDLLFQADVFLADPSNALQYAGNPTEALNHVSSLYDSYQAELLEKREVMASYGAEEITAEQFAQAWKAMSEVQSTQDQEMDALLNGMSSWGSTGGSNGAMQF